MLIGIAFGTLYILKTIIHFVILSCIISKQNKGKLEQSQFVGKIMKAFTQNFEVVCII